MININIHGGGKVSIDHFADICPYCHHAVDPTFIAASLNGDPNVRNTILDVVFKCTFLNCSQLFISIYKRTAMQGVQTNQNQMVGEFKFQKSVPPNILPPDIPDEIKKISSTFHNIFTQAYIAEMSDLDEIAGVGYRKALEFLVKDYCIYKNKSEAETIKSLFLGGVIDKYINDSNIKECSKRAAWLGNDETHYVRKWENKDIKDLKILIQLTSGWIRNNLLTEKYISEMT